MPSGSKTSSTKSKGSQTNSSVKKKSIIFLFKNLIKPSKIKVKHVELIEGMEADYIKDRFSIKGSKAKILESMVADYKDGKLTLPGLSHNSKFDEKIVNKSCIIQIITDYESSKKKILIEDIQKVIEELKKKFDICPSRTNILNSLPEKLNEGSLENLEKLRKQLNSKDLNKIKFNRLLSDYEAAQKQNRGISFLLTKSKMSTFSKRKLVNILNSVKKISLSKSHKRANSINTKLRL